MSGIIRSVSRIAPKSAGFPVPSDSLDKDLSMSLAPANKSESIAHSRFDSIKISMNF